MCNNNINDLIEGLAKYSFAKPTVVYLAGPYRGDTEIAKALNIEHTRRVATKLWALGYVVLCPHLNSGGLEHYVDEESVLMRGAVELMLRCDRVVLMPGWARSTGTKMELTVAHKRGMEVWLWDEGKQDVVKVEIMGVEDSDDVCVIVPSLSRVALPSLASPRSTEPLYIVGDDDDGYPD